MSLGLLVISVVVWVLLGMCYQIGQLQHEYRFGCSTTIAKYQGLLNHFG